MRKNQLIILMTFVMVSFINGQVFETERGKIELLGLKKWNAQTLLDSMKSLNPDKPVHACSGQMKLDFGFVEVSSIFYIDDYNDLSTMYSVVTVIEDNENGKIKVTGHFKHRLKDGEWKYWSKDGILENS